MAYAKGTSVPVDRSKTEIERTLTRYGATGFLYGWQGDDVMVAFQAHGRQVKFTLPLPPASDFTRTPTGRVRAKDAAKMAHDQVVRERWRALGLVIKAKLEAVESGIVSFETEFLPYTVLPSGETVGQWAEDQIAQVYSDGQMPALLPGVRKEITS